MAQSTVEQTYHNLKSKALLVSLRRQAKRIVEYGRSLSGLTDIELRSGFLGLGATPLHPEKAFAFLYQAAIRSLGLTPHPVQIMGAMALSRRTIAEMHTGEGKTLVVALFAAYAALAKKGVHVVTVNEYLAKRDCEAMSKLFNLVGLRAAATLSEDSVEKKRDAYQADITYGTNSEFGFDYLRDNMALTVRAQVQRGLHVAVVDEADSVLIDEARTPLIVSATSRSGVDVYSITDLAVRGLTAGLHYSVKEKESSVTLTEDGFAQVESNLVAAGALADGALLYQPEFLAILNHIPQALRAHVLMKADVDYVLRGGEVQIVDQSTGRVLPGRRWGLGLHQAVEAKERVRIVPDADTKASIIYQTFFKMYGHLCGLTGTASTESEELSTTYALPVVQIPSNRTLIRKDLPDLLFKTKAAKWEYLVKYVAKVHRTDGNPILIGTADVGQSEIVSSLLASQGIEHEVLNAKNHAREAEIVSKAGRRGAVTVATSMAGRGTDIQLGGARPSVGDAAHADWLAENTYLKCIGGLHVLGSERASLRRIDNQLKGRSGRQGDPGVSLFLMSMEDDLLRVFAQSKVGTLLNAIEEQSEGVTCDGALNRLVRQAQEVQEQKGRETRQQLTKFDQSISEQRVAVYSLRQDLLTGRLFALDYAKELIEHYAHALVLESKDRVSLGDPNAAISHMKELKRRVKDDFGISISSLKWKGLPDSRVTELLCERLVEAADLSDLGHEIILPKTLKAIDTAWVDHLTALSEIQKNSSLSAFAGKNPILIFKERAFEAFNQFKDAVSFCLAADLLAQPAAPAFSPDTSRLRDARLDGFLADKEVEVARELRWVSRNELCPCGSSIKYKLCHGRLS